MREENPLCHQSSRSSPPNANAPSRLIDNINVAVTELHVCVILERCSISSL